MAHRTTRFLFTAAVAAITHLSAPAVNAQQVYRIVGADGKVSFSDQPPPAASSAKTTAAKPSVGGAGSAAVLPFELRQVASKYPVTLYTGENCGPCGTARALLSGRGVPFTEKTIGSLEDIKALQRLSGESSLPFATIGGQQLNGFSDTEWTQFLNAAGYPAKSVLPAGYRQATATPLVAVAAVAAPTPTSATAGGAATANATPAEARSATPAVTANPAGIKF